MTSYQTANIQPLNPSNPTLLLNQKIDYLNSGFQQPSSIPSLTNITGGAHIYTAAEILNRYTIRSALTSNPVTDTMPTAAQIVTALNNYSTDYQHSYLTRGTPINVGFYFDWTLFNNDTTDDLVVRGSTGVNFLNGSSIMVLPTSYAVMRITVTNVTVPVVSVTALSNTSPGSAVIDVSNVAALKALNVTYVSDGSLIRTDGYYAYDDGGQGTYIYSSSSSLPDNGGAVIAPNSGSGRYLLMHDSYISVDCFGTVGNGSTNDAPAIQNAIDYCYNLMDQTSLFYNPKINGMEVTLSGKIYGIGSQLVLKRKVNFTGIPTTFEFNGSNYSPTGVGWGGTILKGITGATGISDVMVTMFPDGQNPEQTGAESGLPKNQPVIKIQYIYFNGNNSCNECLYMFESWAFEICYCYFENANVYALHTFDNNSMSIYNNSIRGYLSVEDGDARIYNNQIFGVVRSSPTVNLPALTLDNFRNASVFNNFIFYSPPYLAYNDAQWTVIDVNSSGTFTTDFNLLTTDPLWTPFGLSSFSFVVATQIVTAATVNNSGGGSFVSFNNVYLQANKSYRVTATVLMDVASSNTTRTITIRSGNNVFTYGSFSVTRNVSYALDLTFTTPTNLPNTNALRFLFTQSLAGTDTITFTNIKLNSVGFSSFDKYNKTTVLINYDPLLNSALRSTYAPRFSYYIKWIQSNQFYLYSSYRNYFLNLPITGATSTSPVGVTVGPPFGLISIVGNSGELTLMGNRLEDSLCYCLQTRGATQVTFTANNLGKSANDNVCLASIEYTNQCVFSSNLMTRRYILDGADQTNKLMKFDAYSSSNKVLSGEMGYAMSGIDIEDDYIGYGAVMNYYDDETCSGCFIKQNKPSDYKVNNKGIYIDRYTNSTSANINTLGLTRNQVWTEYPMVDDPEFTILFKDVIFYESAGIVFLRQDTSSSSTVDPKRIQFAKNNGNTISILVGGGLAANQVFLSTSTVTLGVPYDMVITKDLAANWNVYLNNVAMAKTTFSSAQRSQAYFYNVPTLFTSLGGYDTDFVDGSGFPYQSKFSVTEFRYYSDILGDGEIYSLESGSVNPNNRVYKEEASQIVLDTLPGGAIATYFDPPTNMTASFSSDTSIALNPDISVSIPVYTLVLTSTGGTNSNSIVPIMNAANEANKPIRISYWARTTDETAVNTIVFQLAYGAMRQKVTSTWTHYVCYIGPDAQQSSNLASRLVIRLGYRTTVPPTSASSFVYSDGTVYIARMSIYYGTAPMDVKLNFLNNQDGQFQNLGTQAATFYSTAVLERPADYTMPLDNPPCEGNFFQGDKVFTSKNLTSGANPLIGWQRTATGYNYTDWREMKLV